MEKQLSFGEIRIRTDFNASGDTTVQQIKDKSAELINFVADNIKNEKSDNEIDRLKSLAYEYYELACMYAVKAATAKK